MIWRCESNVCSNPHSVAESNGCYIKKYAIIVDKTFLTDVNIHAVFAVKRRKSHKPTLFCGRNEFFERSFFSALLPKRNSVEFIAKRHSAFVLLSISLLAEL